MPLTSVQPSLILNSSGSGEGCYTVFLWAQLAHSLGSCSSSLYSVSE